MYQSQNPGLDVDQDDLISAFFELQYPAAPLLPKEHLKKLCNYFKDPLKSGRFGTAFRTAIVSLGARARKIEVVSEHFQHVWFDTLERGYPDNNLFALVTYLLLVPPQSSFERSN